MKEKVRICKSKLLAAEDCRKLNSMEEKENIIWKVKEIFGNQIIVKIKKEEIK